MISDLVRVGDVVSIKIPKENREWGYNPCADGTLATVLGFSTISYARVNGCGVPPGVYWNKSWCKVKLHDESGKEYVENSGRFTLVDPDDYSEREAAWRADGGPSIGHGEHDRIGDLPETAFWEDDQIECKRFPDLHYVTGINYEWMGDTRNDGSPMPIYRVSPTLEGGSYVSLGDEDLKLVKRGNVYKYFHHYHIEFKNLEEEATFFNRLGHVHEVRNPETGVYSWTRDQALAALRSGLGHGINVRDGLFGSGRITAVVTYEDKELGERVRLHTLKGFGVHP